MVHGGQQPVSSANIQLYTVGNQGVGSAAIPMLTTPVTSKGDGTFSISGAYTCGQSSTGKAITTGGDQVYIVATDGNPGLAPSTDNKAIAMMAALGPCESLPTVSYIEINELTTVAAAWALAPFMTSATQVGATLGNPDGIQNAFLDAALLVDITTGQPATLPKNLGIETNKLIALADAIASCVNTDGGSGCTPLSTAATPSGGTAPTDTLAGSAEHRQKSRTKCRTGVQGNRRLPTVCDRTEAGTPTTGPCRLRLRAVGLHRLRHWPSTRTAMFGLPVRMGRLANLVRKELP